MTITLAHTFVSAKAQGADATLVSKNEWNAQHALFCSSGVLFGRTTAGTGTVEEITPSSDFAYSAGAISLTSPLNFRSLASDVNGSNVATPQSIFDSPTGFNAEASTTYEFSAVYHIARTAGTSSHTTALAFSGSATITSMRYVAEVTNTDTGSLANAQLISVSSASATTITAANTSASEQIVVKLNGVIRTNGAGTIIPQFVYSAAPGSVPVIKANTYFAMRKIGTSAVTSAPAANWV